MSEATIRAVDRAFDLLESFQPGERALTLTELAARTKLSKATAMRLLGTLERRAMVSRTPTKHYALGPAALRLGTLFKDSIDLASSVEPVLAALVAATNESASFFVREGAFRRCLMRAECSRTLRDHVRAGDLVPLPLGAFGRVIEAFDGPDARFGPGLEPIVTRGERSAEMASVAMPVWGPGRRFQGAVGVAIPVFRLTEDGVRRSVQAVREHALALAAQLGGEMR